MSDAEHDPILHRAIDELRRLPAVDEIALRRVVSAAAAARIAPADDEPVVPRRRRLGSTWMIIGVAAAAAFVGFALRGAWMNHSTTGGNEHLAPDVARGFGAPDGALPASATLRPIASSTSDALPIPRQFVLRDDAAHHVSVVGDFNRWNAAAAPMTRSANSALWSVTIPVLPGRHTYGFMVDDSLFVLDPDPRYARTRDVDLGVEGSVVIVGRP